MRDLALLVVAVAAIAPAFGCATKSSHQAHALSRSPELRTVQSPELSEEFAFWRDAQVLPADDLVAKLDPARRAEGDAPARKRRRRRRRRGGSGGEDGQAGGNESGSATE